MIIKLQAWAVILSGRSKRGVSRGFIFLLSFFYFTCHSILLADEPEILSPVALPHVESQYLRFDSPQIGILSGGDLINESEKAYLSSEIRIQLLKIYRILGLKLKPYNHLFNIRILSESELASLANLEGANALTIDGIMNFTPARMRSDLIRHEVLHAIVYSKVKDQLPWWIEEGLAQLLSGEERSIKSQGQGTKVERKYHQARIRVSNLVERCGFKAFGTYLNLIQDENSPQYSYNKVFNELCRSS